MINRCNEQDGGASTEVSAQDVLVVYSKNNTIWLVHGTGGGGGWWWWPESTGGDGGGGGGRQQMITTKEHNEYLVVLDTTKTLYVSSWINMAIPGICLVDNSGGGTVVVAPTWRWMVVYIKGAFGGGSGRTTRDSGGGGGGGITNP